jgi:hypothetical protein
MTLACVAGVHLPLLLLQLVSPPQAPHLFEHGCLPQPRSQTHKPAALQTPRKLQAAQLPAVSQSADGVHWARAVPPSSAMNDAANSRERRCKGRRGTAWWCASARRVRTILSQRRVRSAGAMFVAGAVLSGRPDGSRTGEMRPPNESVRSGSNRTFE